MSIATVLVALAAMLGAAPVLAQGTTPKPAFGLAPPAAERTIPAMPPVARPAEPRGIAERAWLWVLEGQRELTGAMTAAVRALKTGEAATSAAILAAISFLYGILHAVGPGHGKFVISSYALANERTVRRGILLSFMAAAIQALSAIVIVGILALLLNATSLQIKATEAWLETASWGLIALLGAWLLTGQVRLALAGRSGHGPGSPSRSWGGLGGLPATRPASASAGDLPHKGGGDAHDHSHCCGHSHVAAPRQLEGSWSWT
jgi:nickel/cobalt exporter